MDEEDGSRNVETVESLYDKFLAAIDIKETLDTFNNLCNFLDINTKNYKNIFTSLKSKLKSWKCQTLFNKLEKRSKHNDYKNKPCAKQKILIIGAGPVGLRTAIECAFLGAHVIVIEKRDSFSRNNVLHLWPFLIVDLKSIGVKSFFGKFCAGSLDHISIKRLQLILLKISLFLGVQFNIQTMFLDIIQPSDGKGWRGRFKPETSPLHSVEFDAMVGCDGKYNCLKFRRKEFRGKLAIAITCNFVNKQTSEEARVEEISGVAFIYNQEFFHELYQKTGIELENVLYYRDETHYFVMTAKKKSLLTKGVIKQDSKDVYKLLSPQNVSHHALLDYAKQAADFSTKYQLPHHEFARNHHNKEDVAMFDFTSIHQAESSSRIYERKGKRLLLCIAGDVLLEPFWPTGSGCARGFMGAFDAAWMIRGFGNGRESLDLIQERESIFQLLPQTKPDSLIRKHDLYSINPATRYLNLNARSMKKEQIAHLLDMSDTPVNLEEWADKISQKQQMSKAIKVKKDNGVDPDTLLKWCKEQTSSYPNVNVVDMSRSWQNGLAFCAIIHRYRPNLLDYYSLSPENAKNNCEKAFEIAEEYLGIPPKIAARDLAKQHNPDTLVIMAYVSLYYEALKQEVPVIKSYNQQQASPPWNISKHDNQQFVKNEISSSHHHSTNFNNSPNPKQHQNFGIAVAVVSSPQPNEKEQNEERQHDKEKEKTLTKSRPSKMAILSRLSKRSKKPFTKKSKKEKASQNGVTLKSYEKTNGSIAAIKEVSSDLSGLSEEELGSHVKRSSDININSMVAKTPSPKTKHKKDKKEKENDVKKEKEKKKENNNKGKENKNETVKENDLVQLKNARNDATTDDQRFGRISQLAESVFGDTIVQQQSSPASRKISRKDSTASLYDSEKCHFCKRKVYVAERQSAEGLFFHRSCFRCFVCKCRLLLGNYAYYGEDEEEGTPGKFYCKLHYNSIIYDAPKKEKEQEPKKTLSPKNNSDKRRRAMTQQIERSDVRQAARSKANDDSELSPSSQIRQVQNKLKQSLPQLEVMKEEKKPYMRTPDKVDGGETQNENESYTQEDHVKSPYDRFTPRSLIDRHPSLLRCSAQPKSTQKVTTSSFFTASKFSVSTPNLTKLIQEDSMFEEERKKHEEKLNSSAKKRVMLGAELRQNVETSSSLRPPAPSTSKQKKKLALSDDLQSDFDTSKNGANNDNDREIYGSEEYRDRFQSFNFTTKESFGAVQRRPQEERRAQYPVSMAFTDGVLASGFKPVSIEIDLAGSEPEEEKSVPVPSITEASVKPKKKKLVLKKKKAKKDEVKETKKEQLPNATNPTEPKEPKKSPEKHSEKPPIKTTVSPPEEFSDTTSSSDEEKEKNSTLLKRAFKKKLTKEEQETLERKNKRKEQKNIQKELKERQTKRLWEAQSIQRKLNEVDVSMFELDERANQVEKELRNGDSSPSETNKLMFKWFNLVNEKNTLVRFESELVIQSNSIQLEDRQARLEQKIRELLTSENPGINSHEEVERLTKELVDTVEQRNHLVELLEEDRLRELEEDKNIEDVFLQKAHAFGMDRLI